MLPALLKHVLTVSCDVKLHLLFFAMMVLGIQEHLVCIANGHYLQGYLEIYFKLLVWQIRKNVLSYFPLLGTNHEFQPVGSVAKELIANMEHLMKQCSDKITAFAKMEKEACQIAETVAEKCEAMTEKVTKTAEEQVS